MSPSHPRPELPRLVEQLRILLWLQLHLTVLGFLAAFLLVGYVSNYSRGGGTLPRQTEDWLWLTLGLQVVAVVLLAVSAGLLRRGALVAHPLALVAEAVVLVILVRSFAQAFLGLVTQTGLFTFLYMPIYAALTGWVVVDLFRGEVLRFLWRHRSRTTDRPTARQ